MMLQRSSDRFLGCRVLAVALGVFAVWSSIHHPLGAEWGLAFCAIFSIAAGITGGMWLTALPLVLVLGDLYPWTGRLLWTESDLFLVILLATRLWKADKAACSLHRWTWIPWMPIAISAGIGVLRGWHALDSSLAGDELSLYTSHLNALRVGKGWLWGIVIALLVDTSLRQDARCATPFIRGMQLSALVVALCVVVERALTVGLFDREQLYRATGPFVSMHTGGQHIDAFWALALPFVFVPMARRAWLDVVLRAGLLVLSSYAIASTMSRGIIVLAGVVTIILAAISALIHRKLRSRWTDYVFTGFVVGCIAAAGLGLVANEPVRARFVTSRADLATRWSQWQALCAATNASWFTKIVGLGVGTVPAIASQAYTQPLRTSELVELENGQVALRIRPGKAVYVEQMVDLGIEGPWLLEGRLQTKGHVDLHAYICQKALFDSFRCTEMSFSRAGPFGAWRRFRWQIDLSTLRPPQSPWEHCPATLAFSATNEGEFVDIADVQLTGPSGQPLLLNADFSEGSQRWFFTSDEHAAWRAENIWVQLYLEQGIFGVAGLAWLFASTLWILFRATDRRDVVPYVLLFSIAGFLLVGLFGSLLETPWITELLCAVLAVSQRYTSASEQPTREPDTQH